MSTAPDPWTPDARARWDRIVAHRLGGDAEREAAFVARLQREQHWSAAEAAAAVVEYRRFCLVAALARDEATPSEEVDAVWHLHLLHTRDYWQQFCPQALGAELHHGPTRGAAETPRFREQYAATLQAYEAYFGPPPVRWWPDATVRFAPPRVWRTYDPARHWLLPRPRWLRPLRAIGATVAGLFAPIASAATPANPLDWTGGEFLALFAVCMGIALVAGLVLRFVMRASLAGPSSDSGALSTWETAWLAGGAERALDAGVAELHRLGRIEIKPGGTPVAIAGADGLDAPLREIHAAIDREGSVASIIAHARPRLGTIRVALERRGLWFTDASAARIALLSAMPWVLVLGLGLAKIAVGVSRGKPVMFLVLLCLVCAFAAVGSFAKRPGATPAGRALLRRTMQRNATLKRAPRAEQMALAVALVGTSVLAGTALAGWHEARHPSSSGGDSGGGSDSGGGGSGCGGCGGGGD